MNDSRAKVDHWEKAKKLSEQFFITLQYDVKLACPVSRSDYGDAQVAEAHNSESRMASETSFHLFCSSFHLFWFCMGSG